MSHPNRVRIERPFRALVLLVALALGVLPALVVAATPASATAGTCNIYWTGATNNSWATTSNWSLTNGGGSAGRLPTATEFVCMSSAPTRAVVNYPSGTRTVAGVDFGSPATVSLTVAGGVLNLGSVTNGAFDSTIRSLTVASGATLGGTAALSLLGDTTSAPSVGTLAGNAVTTIAAGATFATNGVNISTNRKLVNLGTLTHAGCMNYMTLNSGGVIDNYGTFMANPTCGYYLYDDGNVNNRVINRPGGLIQTDVAINFTYYVQTKLQNGGAIQMLSGDLQLTPSATDTGTYTIPNGSNLTTSNGTLPVNSSTISGAGGLIVSGTTLAATGPGVSLGKVQLNGATVTGSLTVSDLDSSSATFSGSDTLTIPNGGSALFGYAQLTGGYDIVNQGAAKIGEIDLGSNSTYENAGSTVNSLTSSYGFYDTVGDGTNGIVNNADKSIVIGLPTATGQFNIGPKFTNSGQLKVTKGIVVMSNVTNQVAGVLSGTGTWEAPSGTLRFPANITTNNSSIIAGATGNIQNQSATSGLAQLGSNTGTLTLGKSQTIGTGLSNSGTLSVTGGTLQPTTYTQTAGLTNLSSGGNLRGGGSGTGAVVINGGVLTGAGGVLAPLSGTGTFQPGGPGGAMNVTGAFTPGSGSTTAIPITGSGIQGTDFAAMVVSGAATLSGTLALSSGAGYFPAVGTTYRILQAGSRTGTYSSVTGENLSNGTYYEVSYDATGVTLTVRADPGASSTNASIAEGNSGTSIVSVPVTLSAASTRTVSVDYTTVDQTATAGSDYVSTSGTLTFAAGETTKNVDVTVNGDSFFEPDETFLVRISNPVHTLIAMADGTVTITNDDAAPSNPTVSAVSPAQVGQGALNRTLTITGTEFTPGSTVSFSRAGISLVSGSTTLVDSNTITVRVNVTGSMPTGNVGVTVTTSFANGSCAICLAISAKGLAASTSPSLGQGAKLREVTVSGNNFQPGATVKIAGATVTSTSYVDVNTIEVLVTISTTRTVGNYNVTVTNPDGGVGVCANCFTVVAGPKPTSITPSSAARGSLVSVTISGTNFTAGAKVTGPTGVTFDGIVVVNPTTITAAMTVSSTAPTGASKVITVTNPKSAGYGVGTALVLTVTS